MRYSERERTLDIAFRGERGVYRYFDVPGTEWRAFRSAASKGTYLNQVFKDRGYGYEKLAVSSDARRSLLRSAVREDDSFWGEPLVDRPGSE